MRTGILFAAALVAAGPSCKKHERPPPAARGPSPDGLTIASTGAEPRRALRYHLTKGSAASMDLVMDLDLAQSDGDAAQVTKSMPTLALALKVAVDEVRPDGSAQLRVTVFNATAADRPGEPVTAAQMDPVLVQLAGTAITATLGADGSLRDSRVVPGPAPLPAPLAQQVDTIGKSLEQGSVTLPADPVGVGARWTTHRAIEQGGVKLTADTTFEIVALDGDRLTFRDTSTFTGSPQHVQQGDLAVDIERATGRADGSGTVDLARGVMTGEVASAFTMAMKIGPAAPLSTVTVSTKVKFQPPAATPPAPAPSGSAAP